jgi:hypothetical protein
VRVGTLRALLALANDNDLVMGMDEDNGGLFNVRAVEIEPAQEDGEGNLISTAGDTVWLKLEDM